MRVNPPAGRKCPIAPLEPLNVGFRDLLNHPLDALSRHLPTPGKVRYRAKFEEASLSSVNQ
jgi:hypothetical protein